MVEKLSLVRRDVHRPARRRFDVVEFCLFFGVWVLVRICNSTLARPATFIFPV